MASALFILRYIQRVSLFPVPVVVVSLRSRVNVLFFTRSSTSSAVYVFVLCVGVFERVFYMVTEKGSTNSSAAVILLDVVFVCVLASR